MRVTCSSQEKAIKSSSSHSAYRRDLATDSFATPLEKEVGFTSKPDFVLVQLGRPEIYGLSADSPETSHKHFFFQRYDLCHVNTLMTYLLNNVSGEQTVNAEREDSATVLRV